MQTLPWGLTQSQTGIVVIAFVVVLVGLFILRTVFRVGMALVRLGCIALVVIAAIAFVMAFLNHVSP